MLTDKNVSDKKQILEKDEMILNTAIDMQAILQLLVEKEIVSRDDVRRMRIVVGKSQKYANKRREIEKNKADIKEYEVNRKEYLNKYIRENMK